MKTRGIIDFYLPGVIAAQIKIILAGLLFSLFISLVADQGISFNTEFLIRTVLILIQLEIFIWLGIKFFSYKKIKFEKTYTKNIILRLILFYVIVLFLAALLLIVFLFFWYMIHDFDLTNLAANLVNESKGWITSALVGILIGTLLFFYFLWQDALKRERKLREEKLVFQYETIKNQVNPHFLFNSLNTLSSLVNGNEIAESFIHKLSSIYRYVLENRNVELVGLEVETEFAEKYFFLQKFRDEEKVNLEILPVEMKKYRILPISLQILIENALKHNSATRDKPLNITIFTEGDYIVVKNNLQRKLNIEDSPGTGLRNLGERLKLVTHKDMKIIETKDEFIVKIPLIPA